MPFIDNGLIRIGYHQKIPPGKICYAATSMAVKYEGKWRSIMTAEKQNAGALLTLATRHPIPDMPGFAHNPTLGGDCNANMSPMSEDMGVSNWAFGQPALAEGPSRVWTVNAYDFVGIGGGASKCPEDKTPIPTPICMQWGIALGGDRWTSRGIAFLGMGILFYKGEKFPSLATRACAMPAFFPDRKPGGIRYAFYFKDGWKPLNNKVTDKNDVWTWPDFKTDKENHMPNAEGTIIALTPKPDGGGMGVALASPTITNLQVSNRPNVKVPSRHLLHMCLNGDTSSRSRKKHGNGHWLTTVRMLIVGSRNEIQARYDRAKSQIKGQGWGNWSSNNTIFIEGYNPGGDGGNGGNGGNGGAFSQHHKSESKRITGISFDRGSKKTGAPESDNFPMTWARDGLHYTAGGDGYGFQPKWPGNKKECFLTRLSQNFPGTSGAKDLWSTSGKCYGLLAQENHIYMLIGKRNANSGGSMADPMRETWMYKVTLNGTYVKRARIWGFGDGTFLPTFLQLGKNNQFAFDDYIYVYGTWGTKLKFEIQETDASPATLAKARSWGIGKIKVLSS